ncbi:MAG: bifunctional hydroxymethylpyrimidine kinase/phosphomethylpyrimidine kinase [Elusimicrobia bacterium]|nr:bifunctional hydroxymethylpyrimidine kinase/phosphomethylpyrimidine kinase [Elusimicrobiota bacterium]
MKARALTIAGSDPGGGAGIQADLKTFAAFGVYGQSAITSVTVQDTRKFSGALNVPPEVAARQAEAALDDIGADAVKTGMLATAPVVKAVAAVLRSHRVKRLVVDPVLASKSGEPLLEPRAVNALIKDLLPLALVVTPNAPEAEALTAIKISDAASARRAAKAVSALGPAFVLLKGGHLDGPSCEDLLFDGKTFTVFRSPRVKTAHTHGTGCTLSAAITAGLALGLDVPRAVRRAKRYVTGAIKHAPGLGSGAGPLEHFWEGS